MPSVVLAGATWAAVSPLYNLTATTQTSNLWWDWNVFTPGTSSFYYHQPIAASTTALNPWYQPRPLSAGELASCGRSGRCSFEVLAAHRVASEEAVRQRLAAREAARPILNRSVALLRSLRPAAEVEAFLAGQAVIVRGHRFDYRIKHRGDLLKETADLASPYIPYELHLLSKETGGSLARGCIVIGSTPVVDQVLAVMLHVQDRDAERDVIRKTNWAPALSSRHLALAA